MKKTIKHTKQPATPPVAQSRLLTTAERAALKAHASKCRKSNPNPWTKGA